LKYVYAGVTKQLKADGNLLFAIDNQIILAFWNSLLLKEKIDLNKFIIAGD
jgi:hypothetical protein